MKRNIIIASHHRLSAGMLDTLEFLMGSQANIQVLTAYLENQGIDEAVETVMTKAEASDEVIIFTDLLAGSVNQKFATFIRQPHVHLIAGMNLPIVMAIALYNPTIELTEREIERLVNEAREQLVYVNQLQVVEGEDDE